ncbi:DUF4189 domain-containing protein [Morganella morganii]|uniref:DUF4189 domain-containing protein n=1 Tax=Morganella morganii TaxID=582 RepID=UPI000F476C86|nr:DUF4189 domain-containing protein [Morganella morganii]ROJ29555.1 hypothetical protein BFD15_16660 [Morganella morganii]
MKVLFGCFLFIFMSAPGYACWAPNCYGAVGFDPKTGQTSAGTDYSTAREAEQALKEDCPSCEYMTFNNSCGTIVYSRRYDFTGTYYGGSDRDLRSYALTQCEEKINDINLNKTRNDKRRSKVRSLAETDCKITVLACTYRVY